MATARLPWSQTTGEQANVEWSAVGHVSRILLGAVLFGTALGLWLAYLYPNGLRDG